MSKPLVLAAALVAACFATLPAQAQQKVDFVLNWVPGGDHAPYYYAKKLGWYAKEGIDLQLEPGKGSALATQRVGAGATPIGLADMGGVLVAKSKTLRARRSATRRPTAHA
jgi:NitT/TauT family transport system substrate-binding protein